MKRGNLLILLALIIIVFTIILSYVNLTIADDVNSTDNSTNPENTCNNTNISIIDNSTENNTLQENNTINDSIGLIDNSTSDSVNMTDLPNETNITPVLKIKKAPWSERCKSNDEKINQKISKYSTDKEKYLKQFSKLSNTLNNYIIKAEKKKISLSNTSALVLLRSDKIILDDRIDKFTEDYSDFLKKLDNSTGSCKYSEKQFNKIWKLTKIKLKIVKDDADSIKQFYKTVVKKDLNLLKEQEKQIRLQEKENSRK
jgi:hypothetical protein